MTTDGLSHATAELRAVTAETHSIYSECYLNGVRRDTNPADADNLMDATTDRLEFWNAHPRSRQDFSIYGSAESASGTTVTIEGTLAPTDGEAGGANCVVIVFAIPHQQAA